MTNRDVQTRSAESGLSGTRESVTKFDMVRRVALAIRRHRMERLGILDEFREDIEPNGELVAEIRAAIQAMRDPDEAMTDSAWNHDEVGLFGAKSVWQTMIDAILSTDPSVCGAASFCESSLNPSCLTQPEPPHDS